MRVMYKEKKEERKMEVKSFRSVDRVLDMSAMQYSSIRNTYMNPWL
ncbi:hypothetical protein [Infirmifilum sp.]|jgi:hypothetical protein